MRYRRSLGRRSLGRLRLLAAAAAAATALTGCASVRSNLGTTNSVCFITLPTAGSAVHHHGHLLGVRLATVSSLHAHAPLLYRAALATRRHRPSQVCLVAFTGHFTHAALPSSVGSDRGHLAVVELAYPSKRLLATLVVSHAPFGFGHPHV